MSTDSRSTIVTSIRRCLFLTVTAAAIITIPQRAWAVTCSDKKGEWDTFWPDGPKIVHYHVEESSDTQQEPYDLGAGGYEWRGDGGCARDSQGKLHVFFVGRQSANKPFTVWVKWERSPGSWWDYTGGQSDPSAWFSFGSPTSGNVQDLTALRDASGYMELFVQAEKPGDAYPLHMYTAWQILPNTSWTKWGPLGGNFLKDLPVRAANYQGVTIGGMGTDGSTWCDNHPSPSQSYSGWHRCSSQEELQLGYREASKGPECGATTAQTSSTVGLIRGPRTTFASGA